METQPSCGSRKSLEFHSRPSVFGLASLLFTLQELGINVGLLRKKRAVSEGVSEPEAVEAASPEAA
jgi:hypothetical protein